MAFTAQQLDFLPVMLRVGGDLRDIFSRLLLSKKTKVQNNVKHDMCTLMHRILLSFVHCYKKKFESGQLKKEGRYSLAIGFGDAIP